MANTAEGDSLEALRERSKALEEEHRAIIQQIRKVEQERLEQKKNATWAKLEKMTDEEKESILSLVPHEYDSCSHAMNGWCYSRNRYSCKRCMLEEMFNGEHGGRFDFRLDVVIEENRV